jgi:hypothetical protein
MPKGPRANVKRPSSYSESFIDIERELAYDPLPIQVKEEPLPIHVPQEIPYVCTFLVKSSIHLFLISAFETVFFFTYVAGKEDNGIEGTINSYYTPIKNSCPSWSNTTRWVIYEILSSGHEIQKITNDGLDSYNSRMKINTQLLYYSLIASAVFLAILGGVTATLVYRGIKINWSKTVSENIMMVLLLGLYEYVFFMTIIYNYNSISTNELNSYIVNGIYDCVAQGKS